MAPVLASAAAKFKLVIDPGFKLLASDDDDVDEEALAAPDDADDEEAAADDSSLWFLAVALWIESRVGMGRDKS